MSMDINIHITADSELIRALSDIAGCMAAISIAKANHTDMVLPDKTTQAPEPPAEPAEKAKVTKDTKKAEKPLPGAAVSPKKEKEINEITSVPSQTEEKAAAEDKPTAKEIEEVRAAAGAFMRKDKATNQPIIQQWLLDNHLSRVGAIATHAQLESLQAVVGGAANA
ncbi:MAG: hypothetical protein E7202_06790 [Selenomonas ruminantium]|jgi:outer membrane biosynthesis protein TonB|nr:hypothetical protein [Selenomonas ruminantium]